jgi:S-layer homology domain
MAYQSKNHRKFLATSLTAAMVASAVAPAVSAASFPDVKDDNFYAPYVNQLADAGIIEGMPNGTFGLRAKVTRAEAAKMVSIIRALDTKNAPAANFEDVKQGVWYSEYINALYQEKLVDGISDEEFAPNGTLTRAQFAKLVVDAYDLDLKPETKTPFTDVKENVWYTDYVKTLYANGLINGKTATTFEPNSTIDRADFAKLLVDADVKFGFTLGKVAVTSVSATNAKTLTVSGNNLGKVTAEDFTVEGNKVTAVSVGDNGKSATLTLETPLVDGQEYKVTAKVGEETKEFNVKFTFVLADVAVTTTSLEANKDKQFLQVTLNGAVTDLAAIDSLGYDIEFQASKAVFENAGAASTTSSTGEIREEAVAINDTFTVKAVLSKDGKTAESKTVEVSVVSKATPAIGDVAIETAELALTKPVISTKDTGVVVTGVESNTGDVIDVSGLNSFSSSNPEVALINASTGAITPIKAGQTTISVKAGNVSYSKTITVVAEDRVATKATASTVYVAPNATFKGSVAVTDQFGEKVDSSDLIAANLELSERTGDVTLTEDYANATDGKLPVTISSAVAGSYTVVVKDLTTLKNLGQFTVRVSADNVADNYKLEVADTSKGVANLAGDDTVTLNAKEFTKSGAFLRTLNSGEADAADFTVESVNSTVATVDAAPDADGNIEVTGVKVGTTQIVLKKNGVQVATATITVKEEVPTIESITWKANGSTITVADKQVTYKDVFNYTQTASGVDTIIEGVKLNVDTTSKVRIDLTNTAAPFLYLDQNDDGDYVAADDEVLGTVSVTESGAAGETIAVSATPDWAVNGILDAATVAGDKGTLVIVVTDDDTNSTVRASSTLKFDVR